MQAILDQKSLTRLAGGVREGQNMAKNVPRGPEMGQGPQKWTQINQGQLGGQFRFHSIYLERPDIAKIKPGFVEFGLGCSWRVHDPLQYLSFDNI